MSTLHTHTLGYPRIGPRRELKAALEAYWRGAIPAVELEQVAAGLRAAHWERQRSAGLALVTVGDFALYDQVLDHIQLFGCAPARFGFDAGTDALQRIFAMARGEGRDASCAGHGSGHALDMTKWFDTNYHYLVPEFSAATAFQLDASPLIGQVREARALGHQVKAALIGPLTFLWLGKAHSGDRLQLLERLLPCYRALLAQLREAGASWVQIDEPILGLDLAPDWRNAFEPAYWELAQERVQLMLATYFSPLEENLGLACRLPVAGLHVDAVRAPQELASVCDWLAPPKVLSVGIVDGRNIWRSDLDAALATLRPLLDKRGELWLAPSCSLLHVPYSLAGEDQLDPSVRAALAFADEKLGELATLKTALAEGGTAPACEVHRPASNPLVQASLSALPPDAHTSGFSTRQALQRDRIALPSFPTTTIGSFPQTAEIRAARAQYKKGQLDRAAYQAAMQREIAHAVTVQEELGLDVLVHGEAERNDMVEYFAEQLDGYAITLNGWVQSYGSRCVKPPIIHADVARPAPMTVAWTVHAQSLSAKPVKGMLTGPVTMLQWSFVRADQPEETTALQLALAIRQEVADLQAAGIAIIQIDEPALREGLPLRRARQQHYLDWAARAFRIAAGAARDDTQIHTHMCYAEFNDILPAIAALDADVITIETSRSDMALLDAFGGYRYPNGIGPGVYDIHSPRTPTIEAIEDLLRKAARVIPPENLWVNPDCGLKTRGWQETRAALANMVEAARRMR